MTYMRSPKWKVANTWIIHSPHIQLASPLRSLIVQSDVLQITAASSLLTMHLPGNNSKKKRLWARARVPGIVGGRIGGVGGANLLLPQCIASSALPRHQGQVRHSGAYTLQEGGLLEQWTPSLQLVPCCQLVLRLHGLRLISEKALL